MNTRRLESGHVGGLGVDPEVGGGGVPKARIAARLGFSRTTVVKAVASDGPPRYQRRPDAAAFTPFESRVRALLDVDADPPATAIAERIGWSGSITWCLVDSVG
jgi:hypothetical protein